MILTTQHYLTAAKSPDLGWAPVLDAGWEVVEVPGNHDSMIGEPHVHVLAARLDQCLAQVRGERVDAPVNAEGSG